MKNFNYPNKLEIIFNKLAENGIKPIIIGGFVRDYFLNIDSKDIDIELYGISNLEQVALLLDGFGKVNSVGKSFGVCKLFYLTYDLDFSLPRSDSKVDNGHKGFKVEINSKLDFVTATSRRDFTINAIGYDVNKKKILDPFNGIKDLQNKILRAVNLEQFDDDPLRFLRAVVFATRFDLTIEKKLFIKLQNMMLHYALNELPRERIFEEIKKLLLKTKQPSKGFYLLKKLLAFSYFDELEVLTQEQKQKTFQSLDNAVIYMIDEEQKLTLMLALLTSEFTLTQQDSFLNKLTNNKKLLRNIKNITTIEFNLHKQTPYNIYKLAQKVDIKFYTLYLKARYQENMSEIVALEEKAKVLGVLKNRLKPFIVGKDLILLGKQPSAEFAKILDGVYEKQMQGDIHSKTEAIEWLKQTN